MASSHQNPALGEHEENEEVPEQEQYIGDDAAEEVPDDGDAPMDDDDAQGEDGEGEEIVWEDNSVMVSLFDLRTFHVSHQLTNPSSLSPHMKSLFLLYPGTLPNHLPYRAGRMILATSGTSPTGKSS